jgi:hypothetical protein
MIKSFNYSIVMLAVIIAAMSSTLSLLRNIQTNYLVAERISLVSLGISIVWHFCLFWEHFMFISMGTRFEYLKYPACAYFL